MEGNILKARVMRLVIQAMGFFIARSSGIILPWSGFYTWAASIKEVIFRMRHSTSCQKLLFSPFLSALVCPLHDL